VADVNELPIDKGDGHLMFKFSRKNILQLAEGFYDIMKG